MDRATAALPYDGYLDTSATYTDSCGAVTLPAASASRRLVWDWTELTPATRQANVFGTLMPGVNRPLALPSLAAWTV